MSDPSPHQPGLHPPAAPPGGWHGQGGSYPHSGPYQQGGPQQPGQVVGPPLPPGTPYTYGGPAPGRSARPFSAAEKRALALTLAAMVMNLVAAVVPMLAPAPTGATGGPRTGPEQLASWQAGLFFLPFNVPGWLLLVGLIQLLVRRPASGVVATAGAVTPLVYVMVQPRAGGTSAATVVAQLLLAVLLLSAGTAAALAGRQGPHARPVRVSLGAGAALYLLVTSAMALVRLPSVPLLLLTGTELDVGPWLTLYASYRPRSHLGLPLPGAGLVVLLVVLACAVTAVAASATRRRGLFLAGGVGASATFLAHHVALWVLRGDAPLWVGPRWACLVVFLLGAGLLLGAVLVAASPSARAWFASGPTPGTGSPDRPQPPGGGPYAAPPGEPSAPLTGTGPWRR